jgi:hypothetical protein
MVGRLPAVRASVSDCRAEPATAAPPSPNSALRTARREAPVPMAFTRLSNRRLSICLFSTQDRNRANRNNGPVHTRSIHQPNERAAVLQLRRTCCEWLGLATHSRFPAIVAAAVRVLRAPPESGWNAATPAVAGNRIDTDISAAFGVGRADLKVQETTVALTVTFPALATRKSHWTRRVHALPKLTDTGRGMTDGGGAIAVWGIAIEVAVADVVTVATGTGGSLRR